MTLKLDWFGIAENAVADNLGRISLLNFSPDSFSFENYPARARFSLVLVALDQDVNDPMLIPGRVFNIAFEILSEDGTAIGVGAASAAAGKKKDPRLPGKLFFIGEIQMEFPKSGVYTAAVSVRLGDEEALRASRQVTVITPAGPESKEN